MRQKNKTMALLLAMGAALSPSSLLADTAFITAGATWRYLDDGSDQGTAWRELAFTHSGWSNSAAQLGFGEGDEQTILSPGTNVANQTITYYFRKLFLVADTNLYAALDVGLNRDDGAVVYLNGTELFRDNMPTGTIDAATWATQRVEFAEENLRVVFSDLPVDALISGINALAVEVHQSSNISSDLSFALDLTGITWPVLTRGPYLQLATPTSIVVRWRTDKATDSVVWYGPPGGPLDQMITDLVADTEHRVTLTNLLPGTRYQYAVGNSARTLAGNDDRHILATAPTPGTAEPIRIWAIGDSGTADQNARNVRDAFNVWMADRKPDVWLMLGDNAYNSGTDPQYQQAVFDVYTNLLPNSTLWSTLGNHDGQSANSASQTGPYYDIFSLPAAGQAGGLPSGTEAYYAFDYGNIHFVCLESFETDRSTNGFMMTWLQNDLAITTQAWIIA
ncbi:MAG: metallophosphoesterase family protein, partial [Verrucomicrobia bacterium]|nr:metallophosphoesterase family protein [Verrucomicrobiota bacterium]